MSTPPPIRDLGDIPSRADSATFSDRSDAMMTRFPLWAGDLGVFGDWVESTGDAVAADAASAAASALAAASSESAAIAAANFMGHWSSLAGALAKSSSVFHEDVVWLLLVDLVDVALSAPSDTNTDWLQLGASPVVSSAALIFAANTFS
jgi:hypothetical protein